jgi:hypothetical protein
MPGRERPDSKIPTKTHNRCQQGLSAAGVRRVRVGGGRAQPGGKVVSGVTRAGPEGLTGVTDFNGNKLTIGNTADGLVNSVGLASQQPRVQFAAHAAAPGTNVKPGRRAARSPGASRRSTAGYEDAPDLRQELSLG